MDGAFLPAEDSFRKLAAISKRGKSIHIYISKATCDVKQNPFSHDFENMAMLF